MAPKPRRRKAKALKGNNSKKAAKKASRVADYTVRAGRLSGGLRYKHAFRRKGALSPVSSTVASARPPARALALQPPP